MTDRLEPIPAPDICINIDTDRLIDIRRRIATIEHLVWSSYLPPFTGTILNHVAMGSASSEPVASFTAQPQAARQRGRTG